MEASNVLPPVPSVFGDGWREAWERRVTGYEPWHFDWLEHQTYDAFWKHGSLREDYGAIEAATMLVTGWADGYTNIALRGMEHLTCPRAAPGRSVGARARSRRRGPGPNIDLLPEMVRWWDRWLKGIDNGVDREPPITLFVRRPDAARARPRGLSRRVALRARVAARAFELEPSSDSSDASANRAGAGPDELDVRGDVGWTAWISCAGGLPWGQPQDQRPDEAFSLVYDWGPVDEELEILGHPRVVATIRSSAPVAYLSAKLCDVHPDGTSQLVTRGLLNLTHRESRESPSPLEPGRAYEVAVELEVTSWVFEAGHRVRLDLAGSDWPNCWTPPAPVTLTVDRSGSRLVLPTLEGPSPVAERPVLPEPRRAQADRESARGDPIEELVWRIERDITGRESRVVVAYGGPTEAEGGAPKVEQSYGGSLGVSTEDPGRAWSEGHASYTLHFPEATVTAEARSRIESDAQAYHLRLEIDTAEDGEPRWSRRFERRIPRNLQ